MGFGMDKKNYKMMDITACYVKPSKNPTDQIIYSFHHLPRQHHGDAGALLPGGQAGGPALLPQGPRQPGHLGHRPEYRLRLV